MKRKTKILIAISIVLLLIGGGLIYYINDYYRVDNYGSKIVEEMRKEDGDFYFDGGSAIGFIIYPGGKVDEKAYAALAKELHRQNATVVIVQMPIHLAILDTNAAKKIIIDNPQIEEWYLVGHSFSQ